MVRVLTALGMVWAGAVTAADPPPGEVQARVKVAMALSRCRCERPGDKCSEGPDATVAKVARAIAQAKADGERYESLKSSVAARRAPATFTVGTAPPAGAVGFPVGFKGYAAGVYQLTPEAGFVGVRAVPPGPSSAPPLVGPVCPDGLCPARQ